MKTTKEQDQELMEIETERDYIATWVRILDAIEQNMLNEQWVREKASEGIIQWLKKGDALYQRIKKYNEKYKANITLNCITTNLFLTNIYVKK